MRRVLTIVIFSTIVFSTFIIRIYQVDFMAVPKKKTSKSKRNMRRAHDALSRVNAIIDKDSGEYRLPHQLDAVTGTYNGRQVVVEKEEEEEEEDNDEE